MVISDCVDKNIVSFKQGLPTYISVNCERYWSTLGILIQWIFVFTDQSQVCRTKAFGVWNMWIYRPLYAGNFSSSFMYFIELLCTERPRKNCPLLLWEKLYFYLYKMWQRVVNHFTYLSLFIIQYNSCSTPLWIMNTFFLVFTNATVFFMKIINCQMVFYNERGKREKLSVFIKTTLYPKL